MSSIQRLSRVVLAGLAPVLVAALVPIGGGAEAGAATQGAPIKVGLLADNSGVYSAVFGGVTTGMEAKLNAVNKAGGVNGHKISFQVYDTQSSPTQAVAVAKQAVDQGNFSLLVGSQFASYALPYLKQQNIPMVGWAVSPGWSGPSMFGISGSGETKSGAAAGSDEIIAYVKSLGYRKIAILADASAGSSNGGKTGIAEAKQLGLKVVYQNVEVPAYGSNLSLVLPIVQKIQQAGAQFIVSYMGVTGPIVQAVAQQGSKAKLMILTGYGPGLVQQLGAELNGVYVSLNAAPYMTATSPGIKQFKKDMAAEGVTGTPLYYNELGYIVASQFVWGLQRSGKTPTQKSLVKALNSMKNETLGGLITPITYPAMRYSSTPCGVMTQVQNGQFIQVGQKPWQCGKIVVSG